MMTPEQQNAIDKAREGAQKLKTFADKARALGLPVLESFLREASISCQAGADFQARAFKDNLLSQTGKVVIDREPRNNVQADVIAEAIKRKGLL